MSEDLEAASLPLLLLGELQAAPVDTAVFRTQRRASRKWKGPSHGREVRAGPGEFELRAGAGGRGGAGASGRRLGSLGRLQALDLRSCSFRPGRGARAARIPGRRECAAGLEAEHLVKTRGRAPAGPRLPPVTVPPGRERQALRPESCGERGREGSPCSDSYPPCSPEWVGGWCRLLRVTAGRVERSPDARHLTFLCSVSP